MSALGRLAWVVASLLLGTPSAAVPASSSTGRTLSMLSKTEDFMHGHFAHASGTMVFSAAPHNLTIETVLPDGSVLQVLHASKHCQRPHEDKVSCKDDKRFSVVAMAPDTGAATKGANKLLEVDSKFFRIPDDINTNDEHAIANYFHTNKEQLVESHPARVTEAEYDGASAAFMASHGDHLKPLPDLYASMYAKHDVVGRFFPSAIPLYVLAMNVDQAFKISTSEDQATEAPEEDLAGGMVEQSEESHRRTQWGGGRYFSGSDHIDACSNSGYSSNDRYCTVSHDCSPRARVCIPLSFRRNLAFEFITTAWMN
jgi:hypothetical protein